MSKWLLIGALFGSWFACDVVADEYDPLKVESLASVRSLDLSVIDAERDREIPIRIYLPPDSVDKPKRTPQPVVLFSHGLGGARARSPFLGKQWAARGYVAVFLQHPGSDELVWKDQPLIKRIAAMPEAASGKNFLLRAQDVPSGSGRHTRSSRHDSQLSPAGNDRGRDPPAVSPRAARRHPRCLGLRLRSSRVNGSRLGRRR